MQEPAVTPGAVVDGTASTNAPTLVLRSSMQPMADADIVAVKGRADAESAPILAEQIDASMVAGSRTVIVDLQGCESLDGEAMRVLVDAGAALRAQGRKMLVIASSSNAGSVLATT